MAAIDELKQLLGPATPRVCSPDDWADVESYVGSSLPSDFKTFMDADGAGVVSDEFHVSWGRCAPLALTLEIPDFAATAACFG